MNILVKYAMLKQVLVDMEIKNDDQYADVSLYLRLKNPPFIRRLFVPTMEQDQYKRWAL